MKVLIVDDEAPARARLRALLGEIADAEVAGEAADGREAVECAGRVQPDVVLLDIRMPRMDGLEAARHLARLDSPPAVVFTTAYGEHALEAFEADAVDYLLKPIRRARLEQALGKARRLGGAEADRLPGGPRTHLCARVRGSLVLVPVADIFYFHADQKYVAVRYPDGEVLVEDSLKTLEDEFGARFVRAHRNALVAVDQLQSLERGADGVLRLCLRDCEDRIEVSRRHAAEIRGLFRGG